MPRCSSRILSKGASSMGSYTDKNPPPSKVPARLTLISLILLIAYTVALFVALTLSINWLVWVLVAPGIGIGIPILLLSFIPFTSWMHRKARANDLEIADLGIAAEGCLEV